MTTIIKRTVTIKAMWMRTTENQKATHVAPLLVTITVPVGYRMALQARTQVHTGQSAGRW